jgi:DNA-binding NarL/FixJ family response regulator
MKTIKIIIADDHHLVREGLKSLLKTEDYLEIIAEAENGIELLELTTANKPDVVLVDISMPKMNGIEVTAEIKKRFSDLGIIILSMHSEPSYIMKSIEAGADSYLLKNVAKTTLVEIIKKVANGEQTFPTEISVLMAKGIQQNKQQQKQQIELTERELEVLRCVANGLSTKQIADLLCIGTRTVETHRLNLIKKTEVQNSAGLVRYFFDKIENNATLT